MAFFPVFIDLENRKCVVVGGGNVATRKIETLINFCNDITVISPEATEEISKLFDENRLKLIRSMYSQEYIKDAYLIIAATSCKSTNEKIYNYAIEKNILINVVDCPEKCTFIFPSIVKREDLIIGISTSGNYPVLSKRIRKLIEDVIPKNIGEKLNLLKKYRSRIIDNIKDSHKKKDVMNKILNLIISNDENINNDDLLIKIENIIGEENNEKNN